MFCSCHAFPALEQNCFILQVSSQKWVEQANLWISGELTAQDYSKHNPREFFKEGKMFQCWYNTVSIPMMVWIHTIRDDTKLIRGEAVLIRIKSLGKKLWKLKTKINHLAIIAKDDTLGIRFLVKKPVFHFSLRVCALHQLLLSVSSAL